MSHQPQQRPHLPVFVGAGSALAGFLLFRYGLKRELSTWDLAALGIGAGAVTSLAPTVVRQIESTVNPAISESSGQAVPVLPAQPPITSWNSSSYDIGITRFGTSRELFHYLLNNADGPRFHDLLVKNHYDVKLRYNNTEFRVYRDDGTSGGPHSDLVQRLGVRDKYGNDVGLSAIFGPGYDGTAGVVWLVDKLIKNAEKRDSMSLKDVLIIGAVAGGVVMVSPAVMSKMHYVNYVL
ncbi:hypothetical protein PAPYR_11452 [Paratrimastix pyriformis]|uniref:Uncharacterized protein n=1 Tax=Paratrimastix pyriformis TaxID=342808 RepID=A0ABQ8U7I4_9EUKA|nr:hypothetical protein PAPYR_11452 [Paratrimastix pyriformis]